MKTRIKADSSFDGLQERSGQMQYSVTSINRSPLGVIERKPTLAKRPADSRRHVSGRDGRGTSVLARRAIGVGGEISRPFVPHHS